jgi:hypothetical protein
VSEWFRIAPRRRATAWGEHTRVALTENITAEELQPLTLYRFIMGTDSDFTVMPPSEMAELNDPMAALLKRGRFPLTVDSVLRELDASGTLPRQSSFLISEAGQIPPDQSPLLHRDMRFAIVRGESGEADLAISTSAVDDPEVAFLQVAGWDPQPGLFNYYMRISWTWVWAGNSYDALRSTSRGNGCFDSHANGSLVMKELKQPWMNWQSENATIALADNDPLRQNALYRSLSGAQTLENIVRAGISRWTAARLKHAVTADGKVANVDWLLRQLCTTTTVNLTSTTTASRVAANRPEEALTLPLGFWLNADALLNSLEIPADFTFPSVAGKLYADSIMRYGFALMQGDFRQQGDTFFAFVVPEASFEDIDVVSQMVSAGVLSAHFAASILMVDFPNPVFSPARAKLLQYMPTTATIDLAAGGLSQQIAQVISQAAQDQPADSPEAEFNANWELADSDWRNVFAAKIEAYMTAVSNRISSVEGFDDYVRLAESRRREFKRMRLNEFSLTLPTTNIPVGAPLLQMQSDATIHEKSDSSHQTRLRSSS